MLKPESEISRQARWQRKHRAMGLCVLCSRPAYKGWRCKKHYEQHKITMRLRYIPKVRGRYKVGGTTPAESGRRKAATKKTAARKVTAKKAAPRKTASKTAAAKVRARKTTARKASSKTSASRRAARG